MVSWFLTVEQMIMKDYGYVYNIKTTYKSVLEY